MLQDGDNWLIWLTGKRFLLKHYHRNRNSLNILLLYWDAWAPGTVPYYMKNVTISWCWNFLNMPYLHLPRFLLNSVHGLRNRHQCGGGCCSTSGQLHHRRVSDSLNRIWPASTLLDRLCQKSWRQIGLSRRESIMDPWIWKWKPFELITGQNAGMNKLPQKPIRNIQFGETTYNTYM